MLTVWLPKIGQQFGGVPPPRSCTPTRRSGQLLAECSAIYNRVTELTNRIKQQVAALALSATSVLPGAVCWPDKCASTATSRTSRAITPSSTCIPPCYVPLPGIDAIPSRRFAGDVIEINDVGEFDVDYDEETVDL